MTAPVPGQDSFTPPTATLDRAPAPVGANGTALEGMATAVAGLTPDVEIIDVTKRFAMSSPSTR